MSDPRNNDPNLSEPPLRRSEPLETVPERAGSTNAMWGWIAGGVVLALLLVFVFGRSPTTSDTAIAPSPPATTTTGAAPREPMRSPVAPPPAATPSPNTTSPSAQ